MFLNNLKFKLSERKMLIRTHMNLLIYPKKKQMM